MALTENLRGELEQRPGIEIEGPARGPGIRRKGRPGGLAGWRRLEARAPVLCARPAFRSKTESGRAPAPWRMTRWARWQWPERVPLGGRAALTSTRETVRGYGCGALESIACRQKPKHPSVSPPLLRSIRALERSRPRPRGKPGGDPAARARIGRFFRSRRRHWAPRGATRPVVADCLRGVRLSRGGAGERASRTLSRVRATHGKGLY